MLLMHFYLQGHQHFGLMEITQASFSDDHIPSHSYSNDLSLGLFYFIPCVVEEADLESHVNILLAHIIPLVPYMTVTEHVADFFCI